MATTDKMTDLRFILYGLLLVGDPSSDCYVTRCSLFLPAAIDRLPDWCAKFIAFAEKSKSSFGKAVVLQLHPVFCASAKAVMSSHAMITSPAVVLAVDPRDLFARHFWSLPIASWIASAGHGRNSSAATQQFRHNQMLPLGRDG